MKKTKLSTFILCCFLSYFNGSGQCSLACYADYTVSLDASGNATITAYDVLDSYGPGCGTLVVSPSSFDCSDIGSTILYTVTDPISGNFCWGNIHVVYPVGAMACYANVNIALGPSGVAALSGDMLLLDPPAGCVPGLIINPLTVSCADIGSPVLVTITDPVSGNSCWSNVHVSFSVGAMSCYADVDVQLGPSGSLSLTDDDLLFDPPAGCIPGAIINPETLDCSDSGNNVFVTITDPVSGNSCFTNVNVENPRPTSCDIVTPSTIPCGDTGVPFSVNVIGGYGPFDYLWEIKGNPNEWSIASGQGTDVITMDVGIKKINLKVTVTDVCGKTRNKQIKIECEEIPSIKNSEQIDQALHRSKEINSDFKIFPNPVSDIINIDSPRIDSSNTDHIYVINQLGQAQTVSFINQNDENLISMNIQSLQSGIYWLVVEEATGEINTKKFIKY